jgi:cytochrome c oxidase subunit II
VRRGSIFQLFLFALVAGGAAMTLALVPGWLPHPASREAGRIDFVFWFVTVICVAIFAIVAAVIVYSLLKFRVQPEDDSDGAPIHGHTGLEIAWTAVPTVLVIAIAIVSAIVLAKNGHAGANPLRVNVTGQQFAWSFSYPSQGGITSGALRLPVGRSVKLYLRSRDTDVIHSFWVPEFSQKQDLLPGMTTTVVITPDRVGTYPVVCTELCGLGHSVMRTIAVVMPQPAFAAWARKQRQAVAAGGTQAGKALFTSNGCGSCHTFAPAGSSGKTGPDLDKLPAEAKTAGKPLPDFVRESIVDPNAYVAPGYPKNVMPSTFAQLPKDQLDALVQYLLGVRKGGK